MLRRILLVEIAQISSFTFLLQPFKVDPFTAKYFTKISFFLILIHYFLRTPFGPREWACSLWISLFDIIFVFLYLSHALLDFSETSTKLLPYAYSTSTAIFRVILSLNIITKHTLHSRVKDVITHNSTVIWSSNFNVRLICKCELCL